MNKSIIMLQNKFPTFYFDFNPYYGNVLELAVSREVDDLVNE